MIVEEKTISSEMIYEGAILNLRRDKVTVKDGKTAYREIIEHNGAVALVPVTADGKVVMVRQYRNSVDRYTLEIPAGGLNSKDEPTIEAAARELEEETGYASEHLEPLISIVTAIAFCDEVIDIYLATGLKKTQQHLDEDEYIDVYAYTPQELADMIYSGKIQDSKTVAAIMAYINRK